MITCKTCKEQKRFDLFYKHPQSKNGYDSSCKECRKQKVNANRAIKADYYRQYDKLRYRNDARVKQRIINYQLTEKGKDSAAKAKINYAKKNPVKRAAHVILGNAIRDGKITKIYKCESCGSGGRIHGHHDDYSRPLEVRWLCPSCHSKWHKENGQAPNG